MGCWNHTDMISQLHVLSGEEVISLFLMENPYHDSLCYSTCYYMPIPVILYGKYNDYGAVEDFTGKFDDILVNFVKENLFEMKEGENKYHDIPVTVDLINLDFMYEADHDDRLKLSRRKMDMSSNSVKCRHVVIKKNLFEKILEESSFYDWHFTDRIFLKDILVDFEEQVRKVKELMDLDERSKRSFGSMYPEMIFRGYTKFEKDNGKHIPILDLLPVRNYGAGSGPVDIHFFEIIQNMTLEDATEFTREYLKFMWLFNYVTSIRKLWIPQGGQGSQSQDPEGYTLMGEYLLSEIKREKERLDGDWLDEDEVDPT